MTTTQTPAERVHSILLSNTLILATAESCTGGLVAAQITDYPGSSKYFDRGFVTYSNDAKQDMINVSADCLERYGAVSLETASEMAEGTIPNSLANISLSITGIAGPTGGTPDKPVGTVCFAWASLASNTRTEIKYFKGSRTEIRQQAADFALTGLLSYLQDEGLVGCII